MHDYRSKADLACLCGTLEHAPTSLRAHAVAWGLFYRLMLPDWSMRPMIFVAKLRHGRAWPDALAKALVTERFRPVLDDLWTQTLNQLVNGKDTTDPRSAGGWNERELATFVRLFEPATAE